jgi:hypothetical protein
MDAKELAIVVVGLLGTYCLPWPAAEPAGEWEMRSASAVKLEQVSRTEAVFAGVRQPPLLSCAER